MRQFPSPRFLLSFALVCLFPVPLAAQPTPAESGWTLERTIPFEGARSARFNATDRDQLYVLGADGLYHLDAGGLPSRLSQANSPGTLVVDSDGDAFYTEPGLGVIFRVELDTTGPEVWVAGFHDGDDDPQGMAIAPPGHSSGVLDPGEALVVDFGQEGLDEIWKWSPATEEGETVVHADDETLVEAVDVAIGASAVYVVDTGEDGDGVIYQVAANGSLTALSTSSTIAEPQAIVADGSDLLVADFASQKVLRVTSSGTVSDVITGLDLAASSWASLDLSLDGQRLAVTAEDKVYVFAKCAASGTLDCDGNSVLDYCDIARGTHGDCNFNGVADPCEISDGLTDCDEDGRPDECSVCAGGIEAVLITDTSGTLTDEATALCARVDAIKASAAAAGIDLSLELYGITENPGAEFDCLTDSVSNLLGTAVPDSPPTGLETLGDCPGSGQDPEEDWGRAISVVAGGKQWTEGKVRLIFVMFDEGPHCGDPVDDPGDDRDVLDHAIATAKAHDVIVAPLVGTEATEAVKTLAEELATETDGQAHSISTPAHDLAAAMVEVARLGCTAGSDCNDNRVQDVCDIFTGTSIDCDASKVPDECQPQPVTCIPDAGPDLGPSDAGVDGPDAAPPVDAQAPRLDTGIAPDTGTKPPDDGESGCCALARGPGDDLSWVGLLLLFLLTRRRRPRRARR